ncbi:unnamed protein product [Ambrosiozyma monospora]|uniref:Unnamed protein product n=1 Tax=Ambrosiozyma monospora TaxID=43982 RepID=A0ACB5ST76_AMBMO|nr:unnamed protein product [Ambrosiozyma monospora]
MLLFALTPFVKQVTTGLPLELKCQILGMVVYDYFAGIQHFCLFNSTTHLLSLIGIHSVLDDVLALVIPRLQFDESLFSDSHFQQFLEFVLSRSIKIEMTINYSVRSSNELHTDDPDVLKLLQFGCRKLSNNGGEWIDKNMISDANELEFVTLLDFDISSLHSLAEIMDLSQLHRLRTIKLDMKDAIDSQGGGYKKTIENLKSWFCSGRKNFKKQLIISWYADEPDYEEDDDEEEEEEQLIMNWASQFINLHKKGVSEFKVNISSNINSISFDSLQCFHCFLEKGVANTFPLRITLDDAGLYSLARLNNSTGVRNLNISVSSSTKEEANCPLFLLSNCYIESISLANFPAGGIDLRNMSSLKKLTFFSSKLNCTVIENLPDTITDLSLVGIESCDLKGCSLMLPKKLQRLRFSYNGSYSIHKFSNTHQLNELCEINLLV